MHFCLAVICFFITVGNCIKYLNTLNKVQIDQKSDVVLPTVSAHCLTITSNFSPARSRSCKAGSCMKYLSPTEGDSRQH